MSIRPEKVRMESFSYKLETGSRSKKLILSFEEENTKAVEDEERVVSYKKSSFNRSVVKNYLLNGARRCQW